MALTNKQKQLAYARVRDIVVLLVAHDDFRRIPRKDLEEKIVIDTCGILKS